MGDEENHVSTKAPRDKISKKESWTEREGEKEAEGERERESSQRKNSNGEKLRLPTHKGKDMFI